MNRLIAAILCLNSTTYACDKCTDMLDTELYRYEQFLQEAKELKDRDQALYLKGIINGIEHAKDVIVIQHQPSGFQ